MIDEPNQKTYAARPIVQHYTALSQLQPAEQVILEWLRDRLPQLQMLDIGVGGGRTTLHFAPLVASYIGIDSAAEMIAACQQRFPAQRFICCDARDLSQFADRYFDLILFSFNGIDYISHADRQRVFQEVCRVGKPGGYFCFSSHNLSAFEQTLQWQNQLSWNPLTTYTNLIMLLLLRGLNRSINLKQLKTLPYAIIRDESHNFRLQTYYVRPAEQLRQLAAQFTAIQIYAWSSGLEITDSPDEADDLWLYYLCMIR